MNLERRDSSTYLDGPACTLDCDLVTPSWWAGPLARPANDAAAPSAIAQPFGFSHNRHAPPRKLVGTPMSARRLGGPLLAICHASPSR